MGKKVCQDTYIAFVDIIRVAREQWVLGRTPPSHQNIPRVQDHGAKNCELKEGGVSVIGRWQFPRGGNSTKSLSIPFVIEF